MAGAAESGPTGKARVLYVFNGGHDGKGFLEQIGKVLAGAGDFTVTPAKNADELKSENIGKYDVVLFYGSGGTITDAKQEQGLWNFVHQGGGIVAVHATDANKNSDIYWELLGGRFTGHGSGTYAVHVYDPDHPITAGMSRFEISDETYAHQYHKNACMRCLLRMDRGSERQSMAWVQEFGKGRVFTTGFGDNRGAWNNPQFQRLVVRALYWSAGRLPKDPPALANDFARTTIDLGMVVGNIEKSVAFYKQAVGMKEIAGLRGDRPTGRRRRSDGSLPGQGSRAAAGRRSDGHPAEADGVARHQPQASGQRLPPFSTRLPLYHDRREGHGRRGDPA